MAGRMVRELDHIPEETQRKHFYLFILEQMLKGNLTAAFCLLRDKEGSQMLLRHALRG